MRMAAAKRIWVGALCAAALSLCAGASPAQGAAGDPTFVFLAHENTKPGGDFEGPCGLTVDIAGNFYVSDYYHHAIDVYNPSHGYITQLTNEEPLDGPCGLALNSTGKLYINNYHRNVVRYTPSAYPPAGTTTFGSATMITGAPLDSARPTGVVVDSATDDVYVNDRNHLAVYSSAGSLLEEVGLGTLGDGYGLALSGAAATLGRLYVADAATKTVKEYDPTVSTTVPVATINGPPGGFHSLTDSAIAVDRVSGDVYVADRTGSSLAEHPETTIYVFDSAGGYKGHLKYNVVDGSPVGLAVDNSAGLSQGRVYVTSGNTTQAAVYAYPPGSATSSSPLPPTFGLSVVTSGAGQVTSSPSLAIDCAGSCEEQVRSGAEAQLVATPDPGAVFAGWSGGGCSGAGACAVTMDEAVRVEAEFAPAQAGVAVDPGAAGTAASSAQPAHRAWHRKHRRQARRHHHRGHHRRGR